MKSPITYGQLQGLLRELHFVDKPSQPNCLAFEHPATGLLLVWTSDRLNEPARKEDIISTRIHLDQFGLLSATDFEKYFGVIPHRTRRTTPRQNK